MPRLGIAALCLTHLEDTSSFGLVFNTCNRKTFIQKVNFFLFSFHSFNEKKNGTRFLSSLFTLFLVSFLFPSQNYGQVLVSYENAGTYTYTVPAGVTILNVQAWGAGASGHSVGVSSSTQATSGGGGGAYSSSVLLVSPGEVYQIVVGAGGVGVFNAPGNNGGNSIFRRTLPTPSSDLVLAEGGLTPATGTDIGLGGRSANCIGQFRFSGGNSPNHSNNSTGGMGGGGSAFSNGVGGNGVQTTTIAGGAGGLGTGAGGKGGDRISDDLALRSGSDGVAPGGGGGGKGSFGNATAGSGAQGMVVISIPNSTSYNNPGTYTFTVPANVFEISVQAWGAGGGGATASNNDAMGGGGGGAYAGRKITVTPGQTFSVEVGQGGGPGQAGGRSRFQSPLDVRAAGGSGGSSNGNPGSGGTVGNSNGAVGLVWGGGTGGTRRNRTNSGGGGGGGSAFPNVAGNNGSNSTSNAGAAGGVGTGNGGNGGTNSGGQRNGRDGIEPGGGGGGKASGGTATSGRGADGQVTISWVTATPYLARYVSLNTGNSDWCSGETRPVKITIENAGVTSWTSGVGNGRVNLYWWWSNQVRGDNPAITTGGFANLTSGNAQEITIPNLTAPTAPGNYTLNFDIRVEGSCWFSDNNSECGPGNGTYSSAQIGVGVQPTVEAGTNITTCSNVGAVNITAGSSATNESFVIWSSTDGNGPVVDPNSLSTATFTPDSTDIVAGSRTLEIIAINGGCTASDTKTIFITRAPQLTVAANSEVCSNITPVNFASGATATNFSSLVWTTNGDGTLNNNTNLTGASYIPGPLDKSTGNVTFTLTANGLSGCSNQAVANRIMTITPEPEAIAGTNLTTCSNVVNFTVGTGSAAFNSPAQIWTSSGDGLFSNATSLNGATYTPGTNDIINGIATLTLTAAGNGSCSNITRTKTLTILPAPTVNAGAAIVICSNVSSFVIGTGATATNTTNTTWTSSGTGSFTNSTNVTAAAYQPSVADIAAGSVTLTLTGTGVSPCTIVTSTKVLTITPVFSATISYPGSPFCRNTGLVPVTRTGTAGGLYTASPAGLSINASDGSINTAASTAGTYTVTYTIAASGGCSQFTTTSTVTITEVPSATIEYIGSPYCTSFNGSKLPSLSGQGAISGGTYTASPSGLIGFNSATGAIPFSGTGQNQTQSGTYTVTYALPAANGCPAVQATTDVTITVLPVPSISYAGTPYCANLSSAAVTLTGPSSGSFTATPLGLTLNATTGTVNVAGSIPGTYNVSYKIEGTGGCPDVTRTAALVITPVPIASFSYPLNPYCKNGGNIMPSFSNGGKAGTFSSTPGLVFVSAATGEINMAASTPGTYTVTNTIAASQGCGAVSATASITITALPVAGFNFSGTPYCSNAINPSPTFVMGGTAGTFSSTAGLAITANTGLVNLSASTPGTYTVTNSFPAANGCPAVSSTSGITITPLPTASIAYAGGPFCNNVTTPIAVTRTGTGGFTGGTYSVSPAGLTIDAGTGNITPLNAPARDYTITYTIGAAGGCGVVVANTTVTILPQGTLTLTSGAGSNNQTRCIDIALTNITHALGGSATLATVSGLPTGVTGTLNAGVFTISGTSAVSGTFNYTITATGNCTPVTATGTLTIQANATLTLSSATSTVIQNICAGNPIVNVTYIVGGNVTGVNVSGLPTGVSYNYTGGILTISGNPIVNGVHNYTVTTTGPCINATVNGTIRRDAAAPAQPVNITGPLGLCPPLSGVEYEVPVIPAAAVYNWTLPTGWSISSGVGTYKITVALSGATVFGPNQIQVNAANGCGTSTNHTDIIPVSDFAGVTITPVLPVCAGEVINLTANFSGAATSGFWEKGTGTTGNFGNVNNGVTTFTPTAADILSGSVTLKNTTDQTAGLCAAGTDQITVIIRPTPTASITGTTTLCEGGSANITISGTPQTTVSYTVNNGPTQTVNLGAGGSAIINSGVLITTTTYRLTQVAYTSGTFCTQTLNTNAVITVNPLVVVNAGSNQTVCSNGSITLNGSITGGTTSGTWSASSGSFINAGVLNTVYTPAIPSGNVTLTLTSIDPDGAGPCTLQTSTMVVTVNPVATINAGAPITICQGSTAALAGSFGGGASSVSWSGGTGTYSNANSPVSAYTPIIGSGSETLTITTNDPDGPCTAESATVTVNVNLAPTVSAGTNLNICANSTATLSGSLGGSAVSGTWTRSGTGNFSNATILNPVYTPSASDVSAGFVTLTFTTNDPAGPCTAASSSITLTISPIPVAVVNAGSAQTICQGDVVNLTGIIGGAATSATWSAPSGGFGSTLSPTTSSLITTYTPAITNGSVILSLTTNDPAGPCLAQVSTTTITVNPAPATPANPTGISPACATTTLTRSGDPAAGTSFYWQYGPNEKSVSFSGLNPLVVDNATGNPVNYFINARNNTTGCWSLGTGSISVTVHPTPAPPPAISSNQPQCEGSMITLSRAVDPSGFNYYWQTSPTGTGTAGINSAATYTTSTSGTFYLRSRRVATGCWSPAEPITVSILPAPAIPANPVTPAAGCFVDGTVITRNGTPGANETWYWQTAPGGFNTLNSAATNTVFTSGTYYIKARNNIIGCWSLGEGLVTAVVNPTPANPGNPTSNSPQCNVVRLTSNGTPPANTLWYWQITENGTSVANSAATFDVTSAGTYYLRARTSSGCWSTGSGVVEAVFRELPVTPAQPTSNSPQCFNAGVTITRPNPANLGVTWYWQGTNANGTSEANAASSLNTLTSGIYYLRAKSDNGCWSDASSSVAVVVNPLPATPTGSITVAGNNNCEDVGATLTRTGTPGAGVSWFWQTATSDQVESNSTNTYFSQLAGTQVLYLRAKNDATNCWSAGTLSSPSVTLRQNPLPLVSANYCVGNGKVALNATAPPGSSYIWTPVIPATNPNTFSSYLVDVAGIFNVEVTYSGGCKRTNFIQVSENQVINGDFTQGNTGFTTALYGYVNDNPAVNNELIPEGLLSVGTNGQNYHPNFWGIDHTRNTTGPRNMLIVNGRGSNYIVWEQNVVVTPNTNYYFSAYAMSINVVPPFARLRFEINGVQVGTIAELKEGPNNVTKVNANNFWTRFYSDPLWNSGALSGSVTLRIVNLETAENGNDFAIDDINFGQLSPLPIQNVIANAPTPVCPGVDVQLTANFTGGKAPYTFTWTGPDGYSSNVQNPVIPGSSNPKSGIYTFAVRDGFGCPDRTANTNTMAVADPNIGRGMWTGAFNTDWYDCRNWASGTIPTSNDDVTLPASATETVIGRDFPANSYNGKALARDINISRPLRFLNTLDTLEVSGILTINANTGVVNTANGGDITIFGAGWNNNRGTNGFLIGANSRVSFRGNAPTSQSISHVSGKETFHNLTVNNTGSAVNNVIANAAIDVNGVFNITNGRVLTTSTNLLTVTNRAVTSVVGGSNTAFVNGPMARQTNTTAEYYFPVGKFSAPYVNYRPPSVLPKTSNNHTFRAEYFTTTPPDPTMYLDLIAGIVRSEWWQIDRTAGSDSAKVKLLYLTPTSSTHWQGPQPPDNNFAVAIIKHEGAVGSGSWNFTPAYSADNSSGFALTGSQPEAIPWHSQSGMGSPVYSKFMQSFSPFGFGYAYYMLLPIRLVSFTGTIENKQALLKWTVADNAEVKGFTVEHSTDGIRFTGVGAVPKGNSAAYKFFHNGLVPGSNYYRLVMNGRDGSTLYSNIVVLNYGLITTTITGIKPTLVRELTYVSVISAKNQNIHTRIFDTRGRLVRTEKTSMHQGLNTVPVLTQNLANAMYNIVVLTDDGVQATFRIMKE